MIKKRLIGVITIKNNLAVQSFSYNNYLPIGKPECLTENLDRWGADEILIQIIDRTLKGLGPDYDLLKKIGKLKISTPIIYSGGIRNSTDAVNVIKHGADRIVLDSLVTGNQKEIFKIAKSLGTQAIIGSFPVHIKNNKLYHYNYKELSSKKIDSNLIRSYHNLKFVSEILLINKDGEGIRNSFDTNLIKLFPKTSSNFIVFGGISELNQIKRIIKIEKVSAVAIGNFLNYKEHSIQTIKEGIKYKKLRKAKFHH